MKEFRKIDSFQISGRGTVITTEVQEDTLTKDVFNKNILIDGELYFCSGIERQSKWRPDEGRIMFAGENVGLLVRKAV